MSEITHLKAENAKLQDENARLRSCLSDDAENARMIMGENAKLRELVRELHYCCSSNDRCHPCPYFSADTECPEPHFADRMRELGIEVP